MKSIFMILICLISFTLSAADGTPPKTPPTPPNKTTSPTPVAPMDLHMESRRVFNEAMNDPQTAEAFRQDQLSKFSTNFDREVRTYFTQHQIFGQFFELFRQNYDLILNDFSDSMLIGSTRLARGLTADYDRLLKIIQETALDLGFSIDAIKSLEVYVKSGSENAYTVSGLQNRIIIVFQRDILRTMSVGEIRAVVGHELGHIRAEHVITGQLNSVMLTLLNMYLVNGSSDMTLADVEEELRKTESATGETISEIYEKNISAIEMKHTGKQDTNLRKQYTKDARKMQFENQLNSFVGKFMSQPHQFKRAIFSQYLDILIRNLKATEALSTTIDFFESVQRDFASGEGYVRSANPKETGFHLTVASYAMSQAFETTADMVSNSVVKKSYLASAMAKLLGADFDGSKNKTGYENRQERQKIIDQLLKQAEEFRARNQGDSAARYLSLMTHPAPVIRVEQIMGLEKYPAIIFADPFMRNLYLRDLISLQVIDLEGKHQQLADAAKQAEESKLKLNPQFVQAKKTIWENYSSLLIQMEKIDKDILQMLLNSEKGGITAPYKTLIDTITKEDGSTVEQNQRTVSGSPRYQAYLRYLAAYRRELMARVSQLQTLAKENPENADFFEYNIKVLKEQYVRSKAFVFKVIKLAHEQVAQANLDVPSLNLVNARLLYLEKVGTTLSSAELTKILGEVQASIMNGKDLPAEESKESKLFTQNKNVFKVFVAPPASARVAGACQKYFGL